MPSPFAHGVAGLAVHVLASRDREELRDPWRLGVTVGAALLADVDLAFRLVDGRITTARNPMGSASRSWPRSRVGLCSAFSAGSVPSRAASRPASPTPPTPSST